LKQRIVTGVIAGTLFLLLLYLGGFWYSGMLFVLSLVGFYEYLRMNGLLAFKSGVLIGYMGLILFTFPQPGDSGPLFSLFIWGTMLLLLAATVLSKNKLTIDHAALCLLGVVYLGAGFYFMAATRMAENGLFWTLLVFVCIWANDSGAYFTGYAVGKHKLWPAISPNKTIEGAFGGVLFSVIAVVIFSFSAPHLLSLGTALPLGVFISVAAQLGDLIQSAYKRARNVKDTGNLFPGHGGVLDRVDSWLVVFPLLHLLRLLPVT